jgi:hypothetical protein
LGKSLVASATPLLSGSSAAISTGAGAGGGGVIVQLFTTDCTPGTDLTKFSAFVFPDSSLHSPLKVTTPSLTEAVTIDKSGTALSLLVKAACMSSSFGLLLQEGIEEMYIKRNSVKANSRLIVFFIIFWFKFLMQRNS